MDWLGVIAVLIIMWISLRNDIKGKGRPKKKSDTKKTETEATQEYVYVIANPAFSNNIFKIGLTTQKPDKRMKQLFTTGVPTPFQVCYLIKTDDCKALEKELHDKYALQRLSPNREFFLLTESDLEEIRDTYVKEGDYVSNFAIKTGLGTL